LRIGVNVRRFWRLLLRIGCAAIVLILACLAFIHTGWGRAWLLSLLEAKLQQSTGFRLEAKNPRLNLFTLRFELESAVLRTPDSPDLPELARAQQVLIRLPHRSLWYPSLANLQVNIEQLSINLVTAETGRRNWPSWQGAGTPHLPKQLPLPSLAVSNLSIRWKDEPNDVDLQFPSGSLNLAGESRPGDSTFSFRGNHGGHVQWHTETMPLQEFNVQASLCAGQLRIEGVHLKSGNSLAMLQGWWRPLESPELDLRATAKLDSSGLSRFLTLPFPATGQITGDFLISGTLANPRVQGNLDAPDLWLASLRAKPVKVSVDWEAMGPGIMLRSLEAGLLSGSLKATGQLAFPGTGKPSLLLAELNGIDPGAASGLWRKSWPAVGRGNIRLDASCPELKWQEGQANVIFKFNSQRKTQKQTAEVSGGFSIRQESHQTVRLTLHQFLMPGTEGHGTITVRGRSQQMEGQLEASVESAQHLLSALEDWTQEPAGTLQPVFIDGSLVVNAEVSGNLHHPVLTAEVRGSEIALGRVRNANFNVTGTLAAQHMQIEGFRADWENQSLTGKGGINFSVPTTPIWLEAEGRGIQMPKVLEGLGLSIPLKGTSDLKVTASGTFSNPEATLECEMRSLEYSGEPLGSLSSQIRLHQHQLTLDKLWLEKPQTGTNWILQASGNLNLESRAYDFRLDSDPLAISSLQLPGGIPFQARLQLNARGQGKLDAPEAELQVESSETTIGGRNLGTTQVKVTLSNHRAEVTTQSPLLNFSSRWGIETRSPIPTAFRLDFNGLDLSKLLIPIGEGQLLGGSLQATVKGQVNLNLTESLEAEARVEKARLDIRGMELVNESPLHIALISQRLHFDHADFSGPDSKIQISGELPTGMQAAPGVFQLNGRLGPEMVRALFPDTLPVTLRGAVETEFSVQGNYRDWTGVGAVMLHEGQLRAPGFALPLRKLTADFSRKDDSLELRQLVAEIGEGRLRVTGTVPLELLRKENLACSSPQKPLREARFLVEADHIALTALAAIRDGASGMVSFRAEGGATRLALPSLRAQVEFGEFALRSKQYQIDQSRPLRFALSQGILKIEDFELKGTESQFVISGSAGMTTGSSLDLALNGQISAALIPLLYPALRTDGQIELSLQFKGTVGDPSMSGYARLREGAVQWGSPALTAEDLDLQVDVDGNRFRVGRLSGTLNGGPISGEGSFRLDGRGLQDVAMTLKGSDIFLNYPKGFESSSDLDLEVRSNETGLSVKGRLKVNEGVYAENIDFLGRSASGLNFGFDLGSQPVSSSSLGKVQLDLKIATQNPVQVRNNLADLLASIELNVAGNLNRPSFGGYVRLEEGGKLYFGDRTYNVQRGLVTQSPGSRVDPYYDILANTRVNEYMIQLRLSGVGKNITTTFSSDPALPEDDVISVLLTGQTLAQSRRAGFDPKQAQSMILLSGALSTDLSAKLRRRFGISQVSIQPNAISPESNPGARLTIAEDLTRSLRLIYSLNLANTQKTIWIAEYDFRRRFSARLTKQEDNTYLGEFSHNLRFGGKSSVFGNSRMGQTAVKKVGGVEFTGNHVITSNELQKLFKLKPGQRFDIYRARSNLERITKTYYKHSYQEARVRMRSEEKSGQVYLQVLVIEGPKVKFVYEGVHLPKGIRGQVRSRWHTGFIDQQRLSGSVEVIRSYLLSQGYIEAQVKGEILPRTEDLKRAFFDIDRGPRYHSTGVVLEGATPEHLSDLNVLLKTNRLGMDVYSNPRGITDVISRYYLTQGYLLVKVNSPRVERDRAKMESRAVISIQDGPQFHVAGLYFRGSSVLNDEQLRKGLPLTGGSVFSAARMDACLADLEEKFGNAGYPAAMVTAALQRNNEKATVDLTFEIQEKQENVIQSIEVAGNDQTSAKFIRNQLYISPGEPQSQQKVTDSIRGLYRTGAFQRVDIQPQPLPGVVDSKSNVLPVKMVVSVEESKPFRFLYGGLYDSGTGPGVVTEFENYNSLGGGRVAGTRARLERDYREVRAYLNQPPLRRWTWSSSATFFVNQQTYLDTYQANKVGFSLQQARSFGRIFNVSYGYTLENLQVFYLGQALKNHVRQGIISAAISRDSRDDFLDARKGSFASNTFGVAPTWLGSNYAYTSYFGQYSRYFPLIRPKPSILGFEPKRSPLVFATQVRLGLLRGTSFSNVAPTERYFAGGGTSIRGFPQDSVSPVNAVGVPIGGDALFILNNELRFPLVSIFEGVGFLDMGNVYPKINDFDPTDLRKSSGFGLRVKTPFVLLRFDFGFPLDLRPGERRQIFFFSIGQAF
jgi:outer membrane protein assembly complex protein YaeT